MNPLGRGNGSMPNNLSNNIQQVKALMQMAQGNPQIIAQQNPMVAQIMQMTKGQDLKQVFYQMCQQKGVNPDDIINELKK